jgi:hypothetical protein
VGSGGNGHLYDCGTALDDEELIMPTVDEMNAAFVVGQSSIKKVVLKLAPNQDLPFFGNPQVKALAWLASAEGRAVVLDEVKQILHAAESVRATQQENKK